MNAGDESIGPAARLGQTRRQLRQLLASGLSRSAAESTDPAPGVFPRSATFRFLLGGSAGRNMGWLLLALAASALPLSRHRGFYRSLGAMVMSTLTRRALDSRRRAT